MNPDRPYGKFTMSPKVIQVLPLEHHQLQLHFDNGEIRYFDVSPYLDRGIFSQLKSIDQFHTVKPFFGSVQWQNEQDFSRDTLYLLSHPTPQTPLPHSIGIGNSGLTHLAEQTHDLLRPGSQQ